MAEPGPALFSLGVFLAACFILSCGANQNTANQNRLASITLTPTTADAETFPDGQVQFTATGDYVNPPKVVTPLSATWLTCSNVPSGQPTPTTEVSVTQTGVAQCASGATGTYMVVAMDPDTTGSGVYNCPAETACGGGCNATGTAQLTCP